MDRIRDVCSVGLGLREAHKLRIRLPLKSLTVAGEGAERLEPYADLVKDEINVKELHFAADMEAYGSFVLQPNAKVLGPKLGADMKKVMAGARSGDWQIQDDGRALVGGVELGEDEYQQRLQPKEGLVSQALSSNDAVAVLDVELTPELEAEGLARDLVRMVQQARKDADLHIADRIRLCLEMGEAARSAIEAHREYIQEQTLAESLDFGAGEAGMHSSQGKLGGAELGLWLAKV
jgi:isoleucyl-tRNA synthetase